MDDAVRIKASHTVEVVTKFEGELLVIDVTFLDKPQRDVRVEINARAFSKLQMQFIAHLVLGGMPELAATVSNIDAMEPIEFDNVGTPKCPKCKRPMLGGAPHGPWKEQWECRPCGVYLKGTPEVE